MATTRKVTERPNLPHSPMTDDAVGMRNFSRSLNSSATSLFQEQGTAINSLIDRVEGVFDPDWIDVREFGALGNGTDDDSQAFLDALDEVQAGGTIIAPGSGANWRLNNIMITKSHINIIVDGKVTSNASPGQSTFILGDPEGAFADRTVFTRLQVDWIDGEDMGSDERIGISYGNCAMCFVTLRRADELDVAFFVSPEDTNGAIAGENITHWGQIENCHTAFLYNDSGQFAEGNRWIGGAVFSCQNGLVVPNGAAGGGIYMRGVIDNVLGPSPNTDITNEMDGGQLGSLFHMHFVGTNDWRPGSIVLHPDDVLINGFTGTLSSRAYQFRGAHNPFFGTIKQVPLQFPGDGSPYDAILHAEDGSLVSQGVFIQCDVEEVGFLASEVDGDEFRTHLRLNSSFGIELGTDSAHVRIAHPDRTTFIQGPLLQGEHDDATADFVFYDVDGNTALSFGGGSLNVGSGASIDEINIEPPLLRGSDDNATADFVFYDVEGNTALSFGSGTLFIGSGGDIDVLSANSKRIVSVADPVGDQNAATKAYVDDSLDTLEDAVTSNGAQLRRSTTQTIGNFSTTQVTFTSSSFDTHGGVASVSNNRFQVPSGYTFARVTIFLEWESSNDGDRVVTLRRNGSSFCGDQKSNNSGNAICTFTAPLTTATNGDLYTAHVFQDSSGDLDLLQATFTIELIR